MEELFTLEFNERKQIFHHRYRHQETNVKTKGWVTIIEACNDVEFTFFKCYISRVNKKKLTTNYLLKSLCEVKLLYNNLIENKLKITN